MGISPRHRDPQTAGKLERRQNAVQDHHRSFSCWPRSRSGGSPAPSADKRTLANPVYFEYLMACPPPIEEIDKFVNDTVGRRALLK